MGYYTRYTLKADPWSEEIKDMIAIDNSELGMAIDVYGNSRQATKWYDHEDDMRQFSLAFPDVHFTLHGDGEEPGDRWNKHFLNGKVQHCLGRIEYPPFDPGEARVTMAYKTAYSLSADPWPDALTQLIRDSCGYLRRAIHDNGYNRGKCTWINHEIDIRELSLMLPGTVLTLHGQGQNRFDVWNKHFFAGKMQVCRMPVVFPPFDPDKLE